MEKEDLISVIVPVYKVEKYIDKCIKSIINQSFNNFELILVDDGSPDSCGEICESWKEKDRRIAVYHKQNGGLSDARNFGIEKSNGRYITFVDSDDFIDKDLLWKMYSLAKENDSDLVITSVKNFYEKDKEVICENLESNGNIISKEEALRKILLQEDIDVSAYGKLYDRIIFSNIRYPVGEIYEDIKIIDRVIENSHKIVFTKYKGYFYLQREGSIMYSKMNEKKMVLIKNAEHLLNITEVKYPNIINEAIKRYVYCNYHILGRAINDNNFYNDCKNIRMNILKYKDKIMKENMFSKKEKIATVFLNFGLHTYKIFWNIYCFILNKKL